MCPLIRYSYIDFSYKFPLDEYDLNLEFQSFTKFQSKKIFYCVTTTAHICGCRYSKILFCQTNC